MDNFTSLKFLDRIQFLFTKMGVDYPVMRKILQVKLMMDKRRVPTIFNQSKNKEGNQFLKSLWLYGLYGLILIPFLTISDQYLYTMGIVFGISMFILMTSMISDFSSVLLDVRDKTILHTKPIPKRTVSMAKFVHICIYMFLLTGAFTGIPLIVSLFINGPLFTVIFLLGILLNSLFIVVLTALIYLFILRFFNGERLRDVINYVQIGLSLGIVIGYQILIRSFEFVDLTITYTFEWWHVFIPPLWFGAPFEWIVNGNSSSYIMVLSLLALFVPIVAMGIYYRLVPSFERNLEKLLQHGGTNRKISASLDRFWAKVTCISQAEQTFFLFACKMMKNERDFKLKVYPALGMAFIFPFIFIFQFVTDNSLEGLAKTPLYLTIYFATILIPTVVHMLKFSGSYKGSWVFKVTPIEDKPMIYSGTLKAFLVKLYLPIFLFSSVVFLFLFSWHIILDLIIILLVSCVYTLITYKVLNNETYPFTQPFSAAQQSGNTAVMFGLMILSAIFAGIHFISKQIPFGGYIYLVLLIGILFLSWRAVFKRSSEATV